MRRAWLLLILGGCSSSVDLFVEAPWPDDEPAVVLVRHDAGLEALIVRPDDGARRLDAVVAGEAEFFVRTYPALTRRSLGACALAEGAGDPLGAPDRAWIGRVEDDRLVLEPDDDPGPIDVGMVGCPPRAQSCEVFVTVVETPPTPRLFAAAAITEELAIFGGRNPAPDVRPSTLRLDNSGVRLLAPADSLNGAIIHLTPDGDGVFGVNHTRVFRMEVDGTVTSTAPIGFDAERASTGADGTTFVIGVDGRIAFFEPGDDTARPFEPPPYGPTVDPHQIRIAAACADRVVVSGPDRRVWLYSGGAWTSIREEIEVSVLGIDDAHVLAAADGFPVFLKPDGGEWRSIGTDFRLQNAESVAALGAGRFLMGGQTGVTTYFNGEVMCPIATATDRNVDAISVTPSGRIAYAAGEDYADGSGALLLKLELPAVF